MIEVILISAVTGAITTLVINNWGRVIKAISSHRMVADETTQQLLPE